MLRSTWSEKTGASFKEELVNKLFLEISSPGWLARGSTVISVWGEGAEGFCSLADYIQKHRK